MQCPLSPNRRWRRDDSGQSRWGGPTHSHPSLIPSLTNLVLTILSQHSFGSRQLFSFYSEKAWSYSELLSPIWTALFVVKSSLNFKVKSSRDLLGNLYNFFWGGNCPSVTHSSFGCSSCLPQSVCLCARNCKQLLCWKTEGHKVSFVK